MADCRVFTIFHINGACEAHEAYSSALGSCLTPCSSHGNVARLTVSGLVAESEAPDLIHPVSSIIITSLGLYVLKKTQKTLFPFMYSLLFNFFYFNYNRSPSYFTFADPAYFS